MQRAIAAVAGIALWLAVFATPVTALPPDLFGVNQGPALHDRDAPRMRSAGIRSVRFGINWFRVQPAPGLPNWGPTDKLVGDLAARGIRPAPFIYGSPSWVASKTNRPPLGSARKVGAWRNFLTLVVERYGPGGTYWATRYHQQYPAAANPVPITAWQIWNEPNLPKFFSRKGLTRSYAALVRIADSAIGAVDPRARIVLGGLTGYAKPTAWSFLSQLYRVRGIKRDFDAVALHPYAATIGQFRTSIERVRQVMRKRRDPRTSLWLTEVGWGSARPSRRFPLNKGPRGQKQMLLKSFAVVLHHRTPWHVQRLFWFDWRDPARGAGGYCSFCPSAGLLHNNHRAKPAYNAFRRFTPDG